MGWEESNSLSPDLTWPCTDTTDIKLKAIELIPLDSYRFHPIPLNGFLEIPSDSISISFKNGFWWISRDSWVKKFGEWLSLLIWPDPALTRQTSTQRPDSQILTFKVLHELKTLGDNFEKGYSEVKCKVFKIVKTSETCVILHQPKGQTHKSWLSKFFTNSLLNSSHGWHFRERLFRCEMEYVDDCQNLSNMTRQTSTQKPDSQILTLKVLHKLKTLHMGDNFWAGWNRICWQLSKSLNKILMLWMHWHDRPQPKGQTHKSWLSKFLTNSALSTTDHMGDTFELVIQIEMEDVDDYPNFWNLRHFTSSFKHKGDYFQKFWNLRHFASIFRHNGDEPTVPHPDSSQWRCQMPCGGESINI